MKNLIIKTSQAIAIWACTHILAFFCFIIATAIGIHFEPVLCTQCGTTLFYAVIIGAVVSSPIVVLLIPSLYVIPKIHSVQARAAFGFSYVLLLSLLLMTWFIRYFNTGASTTSLVLFLLPYVAMAEISFFAFTRKLILNQKEEFESETIDL